MNKKSDFFLLGIILLIIGLYNLLGEYINKSFGLFAYLIVGASLLFLYYTKRKTWALVFGVPITTIGISKIIPNNILQADITGALIFLAISIIFITLYFTKSINGFLLPGNILFWLALYMIIGKFIDLSKNGGTFLIFFGFSFISTYVIAKHSLGKWPLYLGTILIILSILLILGINLFSLIFKGSAATSLIIIAVSFIFIKKGIQNKY